MGLGTQEVPLHPDACEHDEAYYAHGDCTKCLKEKVATLTREVARLTLRCEILEKSVKKMEEGPTE